MAAGVIGPTLGNKTFRGKETILLFSKFTLS